MQKFINLHSGSRVKLLTLAAAAKQPSILPSPEMTLEVAGQYLFSPYLVGYLGRTFEGQDCKQRGGRDQHLYRRQHPL